jgi:hypothetical protein
MNTSELLSKFQETFEKNVAIKNIYKIVGYEDNLEIYSMINGKYDTTIPTILIDKIVETRHQISKRLHSFARCRSGIGACIVIHVI